MTATPNMPITPTSIMPATSIPDMPATPTPEAFDSQNCAWMWATQALPQLSASIQQAVDAKGLLTVQISASAFGENCINSQMSQVRGFATTEADFNVRMTPTDPLDISLAGNELAGLLDILADLPPESTPGPQAGRTNFTLLLGQDVTYLILSWQQAIGLQSRGLQAAELWEALLAIQSP